MVKEEESERYDKAFELVRYGKFHVLYNIFFVCLSNMTTLSVYVSIYWVLVIPDHWCKVPMPLDANYTIEEWRNLTIPRTNQSSLQEFESCKMYEYDLRNVSYENTKDCKYGWDYDTTWYKRTAPSQEDWICDREVLVTNALSATSIGESIGILFFGYIGDRFGRKKALLLSNTSLLIGRTLSLLFPNIYWLFYLGVVVGNLASEMSMMTFLLVGMEISDGLHRPLVNAFFNFGQCSGYMFLAGLFWVCGDWVTFLASLIALQLVNLLFIYLFQIESPKWLLSKGKKEECLTILRKIYKINGVRFNDEIIEMLDACKRNENESFDKERSIPKTKSIFKQTLLLKNFILILFEWCLLMLLYGSLSLNIWYIGGNPFLIYFFQAAVRIPGNLTGNYLCNRIGRRMTLLTMFPILMAIAIGMTFLTTSHAEALPYLSISSGFFIFASWEAISVQTAEILPDSFRSRGFSICIFGLNLTVMSVPYILLLGKNVNVRLPYIISAAAMALGIVVCALSPETLKKKRSKVTI